MSCEQVSEKADDDLPRCVEVYLIDVVSHSCGHATGVALGLV